MPRQMLGSSGRAWVFAALLLELAVTTGVDAVVENMDAAARGKSQSQSQSQGNPSKMPNEKAQWVNDAMYAARNLKKVDARILLDGEVYNPVCRCVPADPSHDSKCWLQTVKVTKKDPFPGTMAPGRLIIDPHNLMKLIGDPSDLFVVASEKHFFSDIDGRSSDEILGVWGGEFGQWLLALGVYEDKWIEKTGQPLSYGQITKALRLWITYSKRRFFYIHSDTDAVSFVEEHIQWDDDVDDNFDITLVPPEKQTAALEALMMPQGIGCDHIRLLLMNPMRYNVRPKLIRLAIKAFYSLMWDMENPLRRKIKYYILHTPKPGGTHVETAWVDMKVDEVCDDEERTFLFPPYSDGVSIYVNHPQAQQILHRSTGAYLKGLSGGVFDADELIERVKKKYKQWSGETEQLLPQLAGLPRYEVLVKAMVPLPPSTGV